MRVFGAALTWKSFHLTTAVLLSTCQQHELIRLHVNIPLSAFSGARSLPCRDVHGVLGRAPTWHMDSSAWPAVLMRSNRYTQFPKQLCPRHSSAAAVQPGDISSCGSANGLSREARSFTSRKGSAPPPSRPTGWSNGACLFKNSPNCSSWSHVVSVMSLQFLEYVCPLQ